MGEISAASHEQASGIEQVNKAVMAMDDTTQQNAALVEEMTSASQSMLQQAKELMRQVAVFKVNGTGEASLVKRRAPKARDTSESGTTHASRIMHSAGKPAGAVAGLPAAMWADNGKERCSSGDAFDEF